jgi:monoterpene epsilon-lactone hydrolase
MFNILPSWTILFISIVKIVRAITKIFGQMNIDEYRKIAENKIYKKIFAVGTNKNVCNQKISLEFFNCEWIYPKIIDNPHISSKYIFFIHGGAFCLSDTESYKKFIYEVVEKTGCVVFSVDYRKAPEYKYPIPLTDTIEAWKYFISVIKNHKSVYLMGDSAGGNLAIGLISNLIISKHSPLPTGCILISPWVDLTDYEDTPSWIKNSIYDFYGSEQAKLFALNYVSDPVELSDYKVSPLYIPKNILSQFPPILLEYGKCEVIQSQIYKFYKIIKKLGINITHNCRYDMIHNYPLFHFAGLSQTKDFFKSLKKFIL